MSIESDKYSLRGVSAGKEEVHDAIKGLDKGLFPNAFCKILPDITHGDRDYCSVMHADTAGTKTSLAYMYWKETGDLSVWKGIVQDAIVMNIDDMGAVGICDNIILSSTIGRNKHLISGDVIKAIIHGAIEFIDMLRDHGVNIYSAGGETADVGDIVRTIDVGYTTFARIPKDQLIVNDIKHGNVIVGIASSGQSSYESEYNSGIGSNGLTLTRHDVLDNSYAKLYPESFDPNTAAEVIYTGTKKLTDKIKVAGAERNIGKLMLSPTRTYLPLLKKIIDVCHPRINGIIHNTGGSQTKVLHFIDRVKIVKDNLLPIPALFELIQSESNTPWKEMFKVLNVGTRLEIYTDENTAKEIIDIAHSFDIAAQVIGHVESSVENEVLIKHEHGVFSYK